MSAFRPAPFVGRLWCVAVILGGAALLFFAVACGAAAPITTETKPTHPPAATVKEMVGPTAEPPGPPTATAEALPSSTAYPTPQPTKEEPPSSTPLPAATLEPTAVEVREERMLELEWPPRMRLGESDTLRLSLLPSQEGYVLSAEFAEHASENSAVTVAQIAGYALTASARIDASGFDLSPGGDQVRDLPAGETVTWRWTLTPRSAGRQRIVIVLLLRWTPLDSESGPVRERQIFSKALTIQVASFLGLTARQALAAGVAGFGLGGVFSIPLALVLLRPKGKRLRPASPNPDLKIELLPGLALSGSEHALLRTLFRAYDRITLEAEFRSGYSGARTFLVLPLRADGRSDAYTIAKLGDAESIRREYENYEAFVKDTLPPITARIQETPVTTAPPGRLPPYRAPAALRYTFIGEPGRKPVSLRQALLENPDPAPLERLFATFGPGWWMQRKPYVFRAAQEYDRALPSHYVVEAAPGRPERVLDGRTPPDEASAEPGQVVRLKNFCVVEQRPGADALSLRGEPTPGRPPIRVRWTGGGFGIDAVARITGTRRTLLEGLTAGLDLCGLPDPLAALPDRLEERIQGTQSILHGDLNLENILAGPGGTVWLIDFAQTREGHALADFAHLQAEIVAHVIAPSVGSPQTFADILQGRQPAPPAFGLLNALEGIAGRCLFNPSRPGEYQLALYLSTLGALKYANLDLLQRNFLYLFAAAIQADL